MGLSRWACLETSSHAENKKSLIYNLPSSRNSADEEDLMLIIKAFDIIKLDKLWSILGMTSINKIYLNFLQFVCVDSRPTVLVAPFFPPKRVLNNMSYRQFALVLQGNVQCSESDFSFGSQITTTLLYVDDIYLSYKSAHNILTGFALTQK